MKNVHRMHGTGGLQPDFRLQISQTPYNVVTMDMPENLGFKPLYQQVRERLTQRITDGTWVAGNGTQRNADCSRAWCQPGHSAQGAG
jgi:hypothetical protein